MSLDSSKMFISVILSEAPQRFFQTETLEREVEGPRGFFSYPYCIREFLQYFALLLGTIPHRGFLKLSICATVKLFLRQHTDSSHI